jgi:hypothetical protein
MSALLPSTCCQRSRSTAANCCAPVSRSCSANRVRPVSPDEVLVVTSNGQPEGVIKAEQLATYLALRSPEQGLDLTNQPASR